MVSLWELIMKVGGVNIIMYFLNFTYLQAAKKRNMKASWAVVTGHQIGCPVRYPEVWRLSGSFAMCHIYIYMNNKVWRERCFILLEKRGFDFFQTQALWHFIMFLFTCIMMLSVLKTFARAAFHRCLWLRWDSFLPEGGLLEPQFLFILGFMKSNPQRMRADLKRLEIQCFLCKRILPCPFCLTWAVEGLLGLRSCCFKIWN